MKNLSQIKETDKFRRIAVAIKVRWKRKTDDLFKKQNTHLFWPAIKTKRKSLFEFNVADLNVFKFSAI